MIVLRASPLLAGCLTGPGDGGNGDDDPTGDLDRAGIVIPVRITALECPEGYDNGYDDDVCLAYNEQIPGPTWAFTEGQQVTIELQNDVATSLESMDVDRGLAAAIA